MKGRSLAPKLIISLLLGFVILGVKADSIDDPSLRKIPLEAENKPSDTQHLIPNPRLRVLIDPSLGRLTTPEVMSAAIEIEPPVAQSVNRAEAQGPNIINYPDGTISMAVDKRHLKYLSVRRCADPERPACKD